MRDVVKALGKVIVLRESYREWIALRTFASRKWKNKTKTLYCRLNIPPLKCFQSKVFFINFST